MGNVTRVGEKKSVYWFGLNDRAYLEELSVGGRIILKWILEERGWEGVGCSSGSG
jgi:hypothetical protein